MKKTAIILAAGKGKRMKSELPKVLHKIHNRPMVEYVIDNARSAGFDKQILVIGHKYQQVMETLKGKDVEFAVQQEQLGTGHAVSCTRDKFDSFDGEVLVLAGDMPLISPETIKKLSDYHQKIDAAATVLSVNLPDPTGYGRIVRDENGNFLKIVEHRDATPQQLEIKEVNTGIICFNCRKLFSVLEKIDCDNDQEEYYLTDSIGIFVRENEKVAAIPADDYREGMGINSVEQLKEVETLMSSV